MTINDGFGNWDDLTLEETCEAIIASPWADRMVLAVVKWQAPFLDDLAQEARLEMWRTASRWNGSGTLEGYLHQSARWKVLSLLRGDHRFTGEERQHAVTQKRGDETRKRLSTTVRSLRAELGREPKTDEIATAMGIHPVTVRKQMKKLHLTPTEVKAQVTSLDAMIEAYGTEAVFGAADRYEEMVLAYHYGEIHEAVADLDPIYREYVYLRFWCGSSDPEIASTLGTRVHWSDRVRPRLLERLAHLEGAL